MNISNENQTGFITPGDRPKEFETLRDCVVREVKEEVNLVTEVEKIIGIAEKEYHDGIWTFVYFKLRIVSGKWKNNEPDEIKSIEWINPKQLSSYADIKWVD
jgi:8-oxo-dGTP diphosphatase